MVLVLVLVFGGVDLDIKSDKGNKEDDGEDDVVDGMNRGIQKCISFVSRKERTLNTRCQVLDPARLPDIRVKPSLHRSIAPAAFVMLPAPWVFLCRDVAHFPLSLSTPPKAVGLRG